MRAQRYIPLALIAAAAAASAPAWGFTYEIKQIGLFGPQNSTFAGTDPAPAADGKTLLENSSIFFSGPNGTAVGTSNMFGPYNNYAGSGSSVAGWYFDGTNTYQIGLTSAVYQNPARSNILITTVSNTAYGNSRIQAGTYVTGTSTRFANTGTVSTTIGSDAWIYNATTNVTTQIPLPTYVGPSSPVVAPGVVNYSFTNALGVNESMGGGAQSDNVQTSVGGGAAGTISSFLTNGNAVGTDVWVYDGTSTKTIGLIDGNNVGTVALAGGAPYRRSSSIVRINASGQVLGASANYSGSTSAGTNGNDMWIYDPANPTGSGANGTKLIAPAAPGSNFYAGGNNFGISPTYLTDSGLVASQFVQFADASRATPISTDAFIYNIASDTYTQVGLTGAVYTQYATGTTQFKSQVGGSSFFNSQVQQIQSPALNEAGQAIGSTIRTVAAGTTGVATGTDVWIYNPSGPNVGTKLLGLNTTTLVSGGGVYEQTVTNVGNNAGVSGVFRNSTIVALEANGAVSGTSVRYLQATSASPSTTVTTAGQDAWVYDPVHGINSPKMVSLTGSDYEFINGAGKNNYRFAGITAESATGLVGGYNYRDLLGASSSFTNGTTAWVFDPITNKTYVVDPNTDATTGTGSFVQSYISYISDTGVAIGIESNQGTISTIPSTKTNRMFIWTLNGGSPTFAYLDTLVDPATYANWSALYQATNFAPSLAPNGDIVGIGLLSAGSTGSYGSVGSNIQAFVLTTPEPGSLAILAIGGAALLRRRRNAGAR